MLDIKLIRMETEKVKKAVSRRDEKYNAMIDRVLELDDERRVISSATDDMKARQNKVSKEIPALKKEGKDTTAIMEDMKKLSEEIKANDAKISEIEAEQKELLLDIPNMLADEVPDGKDDTENKEMRRVLEPRKFDFEPLPHWDLGSNLNILDPARAGEVTGSRFHFLRGAGARLERAIMNFYLDTHYENGFLEMAPPLLVNRDSMKGTGQLPKFEDDMFHLDDPDYFLIPTAEVPITNYHKDEILSAEDLPIYYCAFSSCFRKEGGSAGRDTRGLIRQHQFQKVELVKFVHPDNSMEELETLTRHAESLLEKLGLPYRVVLLCSGDVGFSSKKTYDIEVWMPSYNRYVEISSCSNFGDYQARRARIRFKDDAKSKARHIHTLNGSGLALGRTVAAILENYQNEDGTITIPEVLVPYMQGETVIGRGK